MTVTTDVGAVPLVQSSSGGGYGDGFGGQWIWAFLLFALLGNGGYGFGNRGYGMGADFNGAFTRSDMQDGFNNQTVQNKLDSLGGRINSIGDGICDATFALNNSLKDGFFNNAMGIQGINTNLGNAICNSTYELANRINGVGGQVQSCCCTLERGQLETNFLNERNTNAVIQNATANTQRILDYLCQKDLAEKDQKIFDMSQRAQTVEIIAAMKPQAPSPAYLQASPYSVFYPTVSQSGFNTGCGCCNNNSNVNFV